MGIEIFGRIVNFDKDYLNKLEIMGVSIDGKFFEYFLISMGIHSFDDVLSDDEVLKISVDNINQYITDTYKVADVMKRDLQL